MLRSLVRTLIAVRAADPIRRMLNRALAVAIAAWLVFIVATIIAFVLTDRPPMRIIGTAALLPAFLLAWWFNRQYNSIGAALAAIFVVVALLTSVNIRKYFAPWGQPIFLDITLVAPILVAAFFWRPIAGFGVTFIEVVVLCVAGYTTGVAQGAVLNFAVFGTLTLVPITLTVILLAWIYQLALRRAVELIPEKGETLDLILGSFGDRPDTP